MTDEQLMRQFADGNASALETLTYRYHAAIHKYIHRMMQSRVLAEDLTQECFVRVMLSAREGRFPQSFRPWLYKIATNLCRDHWRRSHVWAKAVPDLERNAAAASDNVSQIYEKQEERALVVQALNQLSAIRKEVIILRFYQELRLDEISDVLDIPLSTVKSRLYEAIRVLNGLLSAGGIKEETERRAAARKGGREI